MYFGRAQIYGLVSLFAIFVLHVMSSLIFNAYLLPEFTNVISGDIGLDVPIDTQGAVFAGFDQIMFMINTLPYVLYFVIIIWMFVSAIRKEPESQYGGNY